MKKLGLMLAPGRVEWALTEALGTGENLLDHGVLRFEGGVTTDTGGRVVALTKERTEARSRRRSLARKRLRKVELLKILVEQDWCPHLDVALLEDWRYGKRYPSTKDFMDWHRYEAAANPYCFRRECISRKLDLSKRSERYILGRALYHIVQRRGFLSNALDEKSRKNTGVVMDDIKAVSAEMEKLGARTLGEYMYMCLKEGRRVRGVHLGRLVHYEAEFYEICRVQCLDTDLVNSLYDAIFYQRSLKSQKRNVGHCVYEKNKFCCQRSNPLFEEFRMWKFIRSIYVRRPSDDAPRLLNEVEVSKILPLFFHSDDRFDFAEVMKTLSGDVDACGAIGSGKSWEFNYREDHSVSGCPVIADIMRLCGDRHYETWRESLVAAYRSPDGVARDADAIAAEVWQALIFAEHNTKKNFVDAKAEWLRKRFSCSDKVILSVSGHCVDDVYSSVSVSAIRKILPYLREGYGEAQAIFLANIRKAVPGIPDADMKDVIFDVCGIVEECRQGRGNAADRIVDLMTVRYGLVHPELLYSPSMLAKFPAARRDADGKRYLGSPIAPSYRCPVVQRALTNVRHLLNGMVRDGVIDASTEVHLCMDRSLNSRNMQSAIARMQKESEEKNARYRGILEKYYRNIYGHDVAVSDDDILKYTLWEEQKHVCLYTGKDITLEDLFGPDTKFDIEHTVPLSRGGDDSRMNKTICDAAFNRDVKRGKLPSELPEKMYETFLANVERAGYKSRLEALGKSIHQKKNAASSLEGEQRDGKIIARHVDEMELRYISGKLWRFEMKRIPNNMAFINGAVNATMLNYVYGYVRSAFEHVRTFPLNLVDSFRKEWRLGGYVRATKSKGRYDASNAVVIACMTGARIKERLDVWRQRERGGQCALAEPWYGFTKQTDALCDLVPYKASDAMTKGRRFRVRDARGHLIRRADGSILTQSSSRCSLPLCQETFYTKIKVGDDMRIAVRKMFADLAEKDIPNIVDATIRKGVQETLERCAKEAAEAAEGYARLSDIHDDRLRKVVEAYANRRAVKEELNSRFGKPGEGEELSGERLKACVKGVLSGSALDRMKSVYIAPNGKPMRHVRLFVPSLTEKGVIALDNIRECDKSIYEWKRRRYVKNDVNYKLAIYDDDRFLVITPMDVMKARAAGKPAIPRELNGAKLSRVISKGQMALFYKDSADELRHLDSVALNDRLYRISGFSRATEATERGTGSALVVFEKADCSRRPVEMSGKGGLWNEETAKYDILKTSQKRDRKYLLEGYDFHITLRGKIVWPKEA